MTPYKHAVLIVCSCLAVLLGSLRSQAESWAKVDNAEEVRQLVADKVLDGKYWKFYLRSDGKMAYEQSGFTSFREWTVNVDGAICMNIYSMPEKSLGCEILSRTTRTPIEYRLEGTTGRTKVQIVEPNQAIIDALSRKVDKAD